MEWKSGEGRIKGSGIARKDDGRTGTLTKVIRAVHDHGHDHAISRTLYEQSKK